MSDRAEYCITLRVDGTAGDDEGDGRVYPFRTLARALSVAADELTHGGVRLQIAPGIYREALSTLSFSPAALDSPFLIEGTGETILSGLDIMPGGLWESLGAGLFRAPLCNSFGFKGDPWFPAVDVVGIRCEQCFVAGIPYAPVAVEGWELSGFWNVETPPDKRGAPSYRYLGLRDPMEALAPGSFGVTERSENGRYVYLKALPGQDPRIDTVEITARGTLLHLRSKNRIIIRNLVLTGAGNFPAAGCETPLLLDGEFSDLAIENCAFIWNSAFGLNIGCIRNLSIKGCRFSHNGYGGLGLNGITGLTIEDCEFSHNDWRNLLGGCVDQSHCTAGVKAHHIRGGAVRRCSAIANRVNGIWFDVQCSDVLVEDCVCSLNRREGLFFEFSPGPFTARRNTLVENGCRDYIVDVVGITDGYENVLWNSGLRGVAGAASGGVSIGQGMRYNDHADSSMQPGVRHVFRKNKVRVGSGGLCALGVYNRVLSDQRTASDDLAYSRFPKALRVFGNTWQVGPSSFRYEDLRTGFRGDFDRVEELPIAELGAGERNTYGPIDAAPVATMPEGLIPSTVMENIALMRRFLEAAGISEGVL